MKRKYAFVAAMLLFLAVASVVLNAAAQTMILPL